jgi:hypothetical protein
MTASLTACPATVAPLAVSGAAFARVRIQVSVRPQLANRHTPQADAMARPAIDVLHLPPDTRGGGPRGPHPGDVLYWAACVGGACLLLMAATS